MTIIISGDVLSVDIKTASLHQIYIDHMEIFVIHREEMIIKYVNEFADVLLLQFEYCIAVVLIEN